MKKIWANNLKYLDFFNQEKLYTGPTIKFDKEDLLKINARYKKLKLPIKQFIDIFVLSIDNIELKLICKFEPEPISTNKKTIDWYRLPFLVILTNKENNRSTNFYYIFYKILKNIKTIQQV